MRDTHPTGSEAIKTFEQCAGAPMIRRMPSALYLKQMFPAPRPERGDVVIGPVDGQPGAHSLRVDPNPAQVRFGTYDEAVSHAKRFAVQARIDVWVADNEDDLVLLARHRPAVEAD